MKVIRGGTRLFTGGDGGGYKHSRTPMGPIKLRPPETRRIPRRSGGNGSCGFFFLLTERVVTFWEPRGSTGMPPLFLTATAAEAKEFYTHN